MRTTAHHNRLPYLLMVLILAWTISMPCGSVSAAAIEPTLLHDAPGTQNDTPPINPAVVLRQRHVTWDPQLFVAGPPENLTLNLFEDCQYTATLLMSEAGPAGDLIWVGNIDGQPGNRMTLVVHGPSASALIQIGDRRFDLRPLAPLLHVIQEINALDPMAFQADDAETPQYPGRALSAANHASATQANMTNEEFTIFTLVNQERSKHGQFPLNADHRLTAAARAHSQDMSDNSYFSHTSPGGRTGGDRITAAGYTSSRWAENIAHGHTSPEAAMLGWVNSEGHRKNILSSDFCDLGVGYVSAGRYWTQKFGRLRGVTTCTPQNHEPYTPPEESNGEADHE